MPMQRDVCSRRRIRRSELASYALLSLFALRSHTVGAQPVRVVVAHGQDDETSRRLAAETASLGIAVVELRLHADDRRTTAELAQTARARAALRVSGAGIELVVLAAATGAIDLQTTIQPEGARDLTLAVRAVEMLRARLAEPPEPAPPSAAGALTPSNATTRDEPAPATQQVPKAPAATAAKDAAPAYEAAPRVRASSRVEPESERTSEPRLFIGPICGGVASAGGLGAAGLLGARAGVALSSRVRASALALLPFANASVSTQAGSAEVAPSTFAAMAELALLPPRSAIGLELGLGAGAVLLAVDGKTDVSGLAARSHTIATPLALAEVSWHWSVARELRLRVDLTDGLATPRPTLRFDGHAVASFGQPLALALLGAEVGLLSSRGSP